MWIRTHFHLVMRRPFYSFNRQARKTISNENNLKKSKIAILRLLIKNCPCRGFQLFQAGAEDGMTGETNPPIVSFLQRSHFAKYFAKTTTAGLQTAFLV